MILIILACAILALVFGFKIAAACLFVVAVALIVGRLPETGCNRNCREGRDCDCLQRRYPTKKGDKS